LPIGLEKTIETGHNKLMRNLSKILVGLGVVAAIAGVGILIGWLGSRGSAPPVQLPTVQTVVDSSPATRPGTVSTNTSTPTAANSIPNPVPAATTTESSAAATNLMADWENRVDEILSADTDNTNKVSQLFELFPHLSEDGQIEVAQHLSNLVPDEDYAPLGQLLQNAKLPEAVLDVLMADALNRPNGVKLPVLLDVAMNPDNAKAGEAKDLLELYLDADYGSDQVKWKNALDKWLQENKD
jgi:hypothetical protein